ncbi:hypothetical protein [Chryseobacterium luquanense]|uniref:TonB-dependent receptor n=1 Tax=Chryseobacterium luquanense TaxID=2983766 RepID=A0ABT3Y8M5_9FLAO|nr:hypothetical protein [Chryseobacterium luquanense]MCX8534519.1 hypothetical protein [Chryseobacterium luquanense]
MTKIFTALFFFLSLSIFSQNRIKILDSENQKPIPYAKLILKNKDYYKNTEENGEITLEQGEEISEIQSFGYENFQVKQIQQNYLLKPKFTDIDEVKIAKPKSSKTFTIGKVAKESTFYGVNSIIWMVAKELKSDVSEEPLFVQSLKFYSRLFSKKSATIKVNIYYNENGIPGELYKSVIVTCFKNKKITEYIFPKAFLLPKEGIIVGFEWILNQENSYQKMMIMNGEKKEITAHDPMIGSIKETSKNIILGNLSDEGWTFVNGSNNNNRSIGNLGIELKLTN